MDIQLNIEPIAPSDLVAFSDLYEDQLRTLQLASEQDTIDRAWREYMCEKDKDQPKYARIARVYVPLLRQIFWQGLLREEAREILAELSLAQTQPLSSLDSPYAYVGEADEGVIYTDVDSYTGDHDGDPDWRTQDQWEKDYIEVQREVEHLEEHPEYLWLDEDAYDGVRRIEQGDQFHEQPLKVIAAEKESDALRLIEASRHLGCSEEQIQFVLAANRFDVTGDEQAFFDDRGITSEPLRQNAEEEMRVNPSELADLRREARAYVQAFRRRRLEFFDHVNFLHPDWDKETRQSEFRKMIQPSPERAEFLAFLQRMAIRGIEPQYLVLIFLSLQDEDWGLLMEDARLVRLSETEGYGVDLPEEAGTLYEIIDLFGDDILEELWSPVDVPWRTSEEEIAQIAERWEAEIIEKQFSDDAPSIQHTRAYARGVFAGITAGENDLNEAGFRQWRHEKSQAGALAYEAAIKAGKTHKEAWRAFWNAGRILSLNPKGVLVKSEANEREQFCNWGLAKWKLANGEIFLNQEDRGRLKGLLQSKSWGTGLLSAL